MKTSIGNKIKYYRCKKNLSVSELAKLTGTSRSGVYQWEKGERGISATSLLKLCKVLEVTSKDILGV